MRKIEMQRKRSIKAQQKYFDNIYRGVEMSDRKIKNARLRKGLYKELFEEFLVLLDYSKIKYKDNDNIRIKWVGAEKQGNSLNYDGEVYCKGKLIEKVEITCPLISKIDNDNAKELNENGVTTPEVADLKNALEEIKEQIEKIANKKNNKKTYDNSITFLIYMEDYKHFFKNIDVCDKILLEISTVLQSISYQFKEVYLLRNINNNMDLIKIF